MFGLVSRYLVLGAILGLALGVSRHAHAGSTPPNGPEAAGVRFTEAAQPTGVINAQQAIAGAVAFSSGLRGLAVNARYGLISDDQMAHISPSGVRTYVAQDRPVWLLTYRGVGIPSFGPHPSVRSTTELNIVVDAYTGRYLFGYSYR